MKSVAIVAAGLMLAALASAAPERWWLAAKYDGRQAMVYLDTVQFGESFPKNPEWIYPASGFGIGAVLLPSYIAQFQRRVGATRFAVGDRYDLLTDGSFLQTATVTKLLGWIGDEGVGNESYVGAMATLERTTVPLSDDWFAARKHVDVSRPGPGHARLSNEPVAFDIQANIISVVGERTRGLMINVQQFTVADGTLRYYVRYGRQQSPDKFAGGAAWLSPSPALHVLGREEQTSDYSFDDALPQLRNVLDFGDGRTAIIVEAWGEDSHVVSLLEYRDGSSAKMRTLQTLAHGE
jgi:hypothetical protein